ncbi:ABC transporter substrate-binding protein [Prevotella sp. AGR2160]|uniref:ABC transporter substrate-binding protein n=1 Tax=Prevotella sp. AGR2160 TaxID=1280674 RepID=UPI00048D787B|nr:ABC transporter substrate-binding protein [Prevotella sp. AGR2160]
MKKILYFVILVMTLAACGQSYDQKRRLTKAERRQQDSIDSASLKIGVLPTLDCLPLFIAQDDSLFKAVGVTVHLKPFTAQLDCDTALIRGRVEGTITDLVRAERLRHAGIALEYPIATNTYWQLLSNRTARIHELKQLSDKMVAIAPFSATDRLASIAITLGRPKYDVYKITVNDVLVRLKMLQNNEMDAMLLTEPQATTARLMGSTLLLDSRKQDLHWGVFAFRKSKMDATRRKQLALMIKAYNQAVDSIRRHGLQYYGPIIQKYCKADAQTVKALPKIEFNYAVAPEPADIKRAQ